MVTRLTQCIHAKGTFCSYRREQCSYNHFVLVGCMESETNDIDKAEDT